MDGNGETVGDLVEVRVEVGRSGVRNCSRVPGRGR
jgi:hypothetical protein